ILDRLRREVESDPSKMAEVYRREGELMTLLGRFDAAQNALEKSLSLCRDLSDIPAERNALRSLGFLRWHSGKNHEASQLLQRVIDLDRRLGDLQNTAGDLTSLANVLRNLGEHQRALECLQEALNIYEQKPDPGKQATTMHITAITYRDLKETEKALDYLKQACEFTAKHRLFIVQGFHLTAIANIYWQQGDLEKSLEVHQEALAVNRKSGHADGLVQSSRIVGELLMTLGKNEEALPYFLESAGLFAQLGDESSESQVRMTAAGILEQQQRYAEAIEEWRRVREWKRKSRNKTQELEAIESLARVSRLCGAEASVSLQYYQDALNLAEELQDISAKASLLNSIGILYWGCGKYAEALDHYQRALKIFEDLDDQVHIGLMLNSIGVTLIRLERWQDAENFLHRAIQVNQQTKEQLLEGHAWAAMGELWYKMDKKKEAVQCYETSLRIRRALHDQKGQGWMLYYLAKLHTELGLKDASEEYLKEAAQVSIDCADQKLQQECRMLQNYTGDNDA
ncbi:MAG TPA: tetratricopeptide repeat protein, partial [Acidobacteriota bacterium]